jgi:DNA-binding beta-propeller fold protein YncE
MRAHRLVLAALASASVFAGVSVFACASASALFVRAPLSFSPFGSFAKATGVAVDQSTGNVFVADSVKNVVRVFGAEGGGPAGGVSSELTGAQTPAKGFAFEEEPAGVAVDASSGAIYVTDVKHNAVDEFRVNGAKEYEYVCQITGYGFTGSACLKNEPTVEATPSDVAFHEPLGVAVDRAGDLYVADYESGAIYEYSPSGDDVASFASPVGKPQDVAVDARGDIYVRHYSGGGGGAEAELVRRSLTGRVESVANENDGVTGLSFDLASGSLLLGFGSFAEEYDEEGGDLHLPFGSEVLSQARGMAVNEAASDVYVASNNGTKIDVFGPGPLFASPTTGAALSLSRTSERVEGAVNPKSETLEAGCEVQYGKSSAYGSSVPCSPANVGVGEASVAVTATLAKLEVGTEYHYRVIASNANGSFPGADATFVTAPAVEGVVSGEATSLLPTSATLNGSLEPNGEDAHYYFEYGETEALGSTSPAPPGVDAGSGVGASASTKLTGLQPDTEYHYRLVATNALGETLGQIRTFKTMPAVAGALTEEASELLPTSATLHGSLQPKGMDTHYYFEYGETEAFGSTSPAPPGVDAGSGAEASASTKLTGLQPDTTYYYRLVAANALGATVAEVKSFKTPPAVAGVLIGEASGIGKTNATLNGTLRPQGETTS